MHHRCPVQIAQRHQANRSTVVLACALATAAAFGSQVEFGTAFNFKVLNGTVSSEKAERYVEIFRDNFTWGVTEGLGHMWKVHAGARDAYWWEDLDLVLDWFEKNGKQLKYHAVVSHNPKHVIGRENDALDWYKALPVEERRKALEEHVRAVVSRYRGRIRLYDLVNHALIHGPDEDYMLTGWRRPEAIARVFQWAVDTDPEATFVINEKWPLDDPANTVNYRRLIEEVISLGGRVDAIGLMGHLGQCTGRIPADEVLAGTLDELAPLGLPIHVTELDLSYDRCHGGEELTLDPDAPFGGVPSWYDYQGQGYGHVMEFLFSRPEVEKVFFWGFYDGLHWRKQAGLFYGPAAGDRHFQPKPAYEALKPFLEGTRQPTQDPPVMRSEGTE